MKPILIAGPTASGKSALAIALAQALGGRVINADSQQVYADWQVLTARPSPEETAAAPHLLYGHVALDQPYSVGHWLGEVVPLLSGPPPIIVGGTGLYFKALTQGLAPIPIVPDKIRVRGEAELERMGLADFATALAIRDPETVKALDRDNPRRVLRAWEVLEATGVGLAEWRARTPPPALALPDCIPIALTPDRDALYARCDMRFDAMIRDGAVDEARAVLAHEYPPDAPGLKAVGAVELFDWLRGNCTQEEAAERAKMETRRYAKRQLTWIRNQMRDWHHLTSPDADAVLSLMQG